MSLRFSGRLSFTVPVTAGQYAPEFVQLNGSADNEGTAHYPELLGVTVLIETPVANAIIELWLLKLGADPAQSANYFYSGQSTTTGTTWALASWPGAQLRCKSGGTAGGCLVSATADQ